MVDKALWRDNSGNMIFSEIKSKCSVSKLVNWQMIYMIFWIREFMV